MSSTMRFLSYLVTLLVAVFITACGGGGGSAGTTPGSSTPSLFTTAPATLTLAKGVAQDYTIGGGRAPYTATSNNTAIVASGVNGTVLTIGAVSPGTADVQIRDSLGALISVTVTVNTGSTRAFFTTSPAAITVQAGAGGQQSYLVGGGATPHTAISSNPAVAAVSLVNGN